MWTLKKYDFGIRRQMIRMWTAASSASNIKVVFFAQLFRLFPGLFFNAKSLEHLFIPLEWENHITLPFQCFINVLSCLRNRSVTWALPVFNIFCNTFALLSILTLSYFLSLSLTPSLSLSLSLSLYCHKYSISLLFSLTLPYLVPLCLSLSLSFILYHSFYSFSFTTTLMYFFLYRVSVRLSVSLFLSHLILSSLFHSLPYFPLFLLSPPGKNFSSWSSFQFPKIFLSVIVVSFHFICSSSPLRNFPIPAPPPSPLARGRGNRCLLSASSISPSLLPSIFQHFPTMFRLRRNFLRPTILIKCNRSGQRTLPCWKHQFP